MLSLRIANGPYVAVYVADIDSSQNQLSFFEHFDDAEAYFRGADETIDRWYKRWLRRLLRLRTGTTVFKHMKSV